MVVAVGLSGGQHDRSGYGGGSGWKAKCVVVLEKMAYKGIIGTKKKRKG